MNIFKRNLLILGFLLQMATLLSSEPDLSAMGAILIDQQSGRILYEKNAHQTRPPASMTKLVTLYLGCQAVDEGVLFMDTPVKVTQEGSAFSRPPGSSLMLLEEGQNLTYKELLQGITVASGNDGAYQLAQLIGGETTDFVDSMNQLVYSMGYENMYFVDPDGWSEYNQVSPLEYALFSRDYINRFPWALEELHSLRTFSYPLVENMAPGGLIETTRTKKNTNILLGKVPGVDGLKTGYIDESGFNFTATAKRENTRFISVVMGIFFTDFREGLQRRANEAALLLEYGFDNWSTRTLPLLEVSTKVYKGEGEQVTLIVEDLPMYTLSQEEYDSIRLDYTSPPWLVAPLNRGELVGSVKWYLEEELIGESPLVTKKEIKKGSFFHNLIDFFEILFYKVSHKEA